MERPLQDLPVLTKAMVMENFDELVTDQSIHRRDVETHLDRSGGNERFKGRFYGNASSGSTGKRGIFLLDDAFEWNTALIGNLGCGAICGKNHSPPSLANASRRSRRRRLD